MTPPRRWAVKGRVKSQVAVASGLAASSGRSIPRRVSQPARRSASGITLVDPAAEQEPDDDDISLTINDDGGITISVGPETSDDDRDDTSPRDFNENIAKRIDEGVLSALASDLLESIEADKQSRRDWEDTANRGADFLGIKLADPQSGSTAADGTIAQQVSTCMLEAAVKSWSTGRAELLPVGGPVKVKRDDMPVPGQQVAPTPPPAPPIPGAPPPPPSPPSRDEMANALEADLNWYLTKGDPEYYPDFSRMLFSRAVVGNAFRKVYRCPIRRKPVSRWVKAQNLIISNDCTHLNGASRVSEFIRVRQADMRRMQASGHYLDVALAQPTGDATATEQAEADAEGIAAVPQLPADYEHKVYEITCEIDSHYVSGLGILDRDETGKKPGYPMPYRVTIDEDSRAILEIRRAWKQGDDQHRRRRRYVRYGYVPSYGGFYDLGLIHIAGNPTQAATMIERSCVDSALYANFPGGMKLGSPGRESTSVIRPQPGQWVTVEGQSGDNIRDRFMELPYKPPSPEAIALANAQKQSVRDLAGVVDLPVGEGRIGNTPVGTIMSYIEAVAQVPGAVHKDDHITQSEEFDILRELLAEEPELLTQGNRTPQRKQWIVEELTAPDLISAADPNTPSAIHRLMKIQALVTLAGLPQFNGIADQRAVWADAVRLLASGTNHDYTLPQQQAAPPPPDPRVVSAQIKAQSQAESDQAKMQQGQLQHQERMSEIQQEAQQRDADRASAETRAAMSLEAARLKAVHDTANASADRSHQAGLAGADRASQAGIAGAQLAQKHAQHLNEVAAAQQQAAAAPSPTDEGSAQ